MDQVQAHPDLPSDGPRPDRRRGGPLGRAERVLVGVMRSRWVASFIVAFAVSWAFHQVDEISQHRIERQQDVLTCTIEGVAHQQSLTAKRVSIQPILQQCDKQVGK